MELKSDGHIAAEAAPTKPILAVGAALAAMSHRPYPICIG